MYLTKDDIKARMESVDETKRLVIRPLLSSTQIGSLTIDLRLGTDFLLCNLGRESSINVTGDDDSRPFHSLFTETRRVIGESFTFYPHQSVLCSTLEYVKLPNDVFISLSPRSSYSRLGFNLSTIVQPGYCGCISVELTNTSSVPVKVSTGAAILQARLFAISKDVPYFYDKKIRKYFCQVRPQLSKALDDPDITILKKIANSH
jgi:dCTP deaminase